MKNLYKYLVPFAGDYSGVCSALFDMGGMVCIHDAAGCTGNYTHFDEPRYYGTHNLVYCTGFRKIDAILGNEELYKNKIINAAKEMKPKFIAIVGSPVPHIIGFDFKGFAKEMEFLTGIPCFGFPTNGMSGNYKDGIVTASKAIIDRFGPDSSQGNKETDKITVNIIGASPLDISMENYGRFRKLLEENDIEINLSLNIGDQVDKVAQIKNADINLALTQSGYILCKYLEDKYVMPFLAGVPVGKNGAIDYIEKIEEVLSSGKSQKSFELKEEVDKKATLVVADGIVAASIAAYLQNTKNINAVPVSVFGEDISTKEIGIKTLKGEDEILTELNSEIYDSVYADPILLGLIKQDHISKIELPQYAISSRIGASADKIYIGTDFKEIQKYA